MTKVKRTGFGRDLQAQKGWVPTPLSHPPEAAWARVLGQPDVFFFLPRRGVVPEEASSGTLPNNLLVSSRSCFSSSRRFE